MKIIFKIFVVLNIFVSMAHGNDSIKNAIKNVDYIFCIDGGGTKTELQIIDRKGNGVKSIYGSSSNTNTVGRDGFETLFKEMFNDAKLLPISRCALVAGLSGVARAESKQAVSSIFEKFGFAPERIVIFSDAELALENVGNGVILIAGTGSICFGKHNQKTKRAGGLGRLISDEGGGYQIGIQAIRAALEQEYGWGPETLLTQKIREHFKVDLLNGLIGPIHAGTFKPSEIAAVVPLVFDAWQAGDVVAQGIIARAASDLANLLAIVVQDLNQPECCVHLIGGVFKNKYVDCFIEKMLQTELLSRFLMSHKLDIVNMAHKNVGVLATLKNL